MATPAPLAENFIEFLLAAKRATYAAGDGGQSEAALPGSKQLEYRQGRYLYRDIYFGGQAFAGQEVVYFEQRPYWSMVYMGSMLAPVAEMDAFSHVLKSALARVKPERPYRGPEEFRLADWWYRDRSTGSPARFDGEEEIWQGTLCVYRLKYSGGLIIY
jgi:hypothetical protein